jgi:hypothetical protein
MFFEICIRVTIGLSASAVVSGCMVASAASAVVSAGATVVDVGVTATTTAVKGAAKVTKAVVDTATDDNKE